jgi:hypothetical protein
VITPNSVQDALMRLTWGALAAACLVAGSYIMLRTLGLLAVVLHGVQRWWPALLLAAGVAILLRSVKPGPNIAVAVGLMSAGCIAFTITNGIIAQRAWIFVASGCLIFTGLIFIRLAVRARPHHADGPTDRISVLFRATQITPESVQLKQLKVFLLCGYLELDLRKLVSPGQHRDTLLMVEITAWVGNVKLLVHPETKRLDHKAFVVRLRNRVHPSVLDENDTTMVQVAAVTLGLFGDTQFKEMPPNADPGAAGNESEPGNLRPAT